MDPDSTSFALVLVLALTLLGANAAAVVLLSRWLARRRSRAEGRTDGQALAQHMLAAIGETEGTVPPDQEQMLLGVIQFRDTVAREVMTPRRDIRALPVTAGEEETLALVASEGHSRIPVYAETLDEIVGVLLAKDLLAHLTARRSGTAAVFDLRALMREPHFVPDSKRIGELLAELRAKSVHMAIVLDEFGGTEGLVTLEDLIEEIVGEIQDEYDEPEATSITETPEGDVVIDGGASIFDVNERLGLALPERDFDTIGGFVFGELGRVPVPGDVVVLNGSGELRIEDVEERRVTRLRLVRAAASQPDESAERGDGPA
jgi:putative hemolysin